MTDALGWPGVALFVGLTAFGALILWLNDRWIQRWWRREPQMVGKRGLRYAWRWKTDPPRLYHLLSYLIAANFLALFVMEASLPYWGQPTRDEAHKIPFRVRGQTYYLGAIAGPYLDYALPGHFLLLLSVAAVAWHHRDRLERVE